MAPSQSIGRVSRLAVTKLVPFGAYLHDEGLGEVLLPKREVPRGCAVGDELRVFIYKDTKDVVVATTKTPLITVGRCAYLEVVAVTDVGAFLDWGLPKDLFVPFSEQKRHMQVGRSYTVYAYIDNSGRIAATPRLTRFLSETSDEHEPDQPVELLIAGRTDIGYRAVIDDTHLGMLHESEVLKPLAHGQRLSGFIKEVRPDGKIDLCLRLVRAEHRDVVAERILEHLREHGGRSSLTDKSSPEAIYEAFGVSKKVFKRALGGLYREKLVELQPNEIRLLADPGKSGP